ncbi:MAG: hypothetical protein U0S48_06920 [Solirubrobacteraceae bacterium]
MGGSCSDPRGGLEPALLATNLRSGRVTSAAIRRYGLDGLDALVGPDERGEASAGAEEE